MTARSRKPDRGEAVDGGAGSFAAPGRSASQHLGRSGLPLDGGRRGLQQFPRGLHILGGRGYSRRRRRRPSALARRQRPLGDERDRHRLDPAAGQQVGRDRDADIPGLAEDQRHGGATLHEEPAWGQAGASGGNAHLRRRRLRIEGDLHMAFRGGRHATGQSRRDRRHHEPFEPHGSSRLAAAHICCRMR